jgi:hypothetical protein
VLDDALLKDAPFKYLPRNVAMRLDGSPQAAV